MKPSGGGVAFLLSVVFIIRANCSCWLAGRQSPVKKTLIATIPTKVSTIAFAKMTAKACCHSKCKAKHLEDPILAWVHGLTATQLTRLYADAVRELLLSLREDAKAGRPVGYLTRLRLSVECYMKGLWVGLVASPDEVVHDASGEEPYLLIRKLNRIVFSQVLGRQVVPSFSFKIPGGRDFDINDLLNTSTHMTANSLAIARSITREELVRMHFPIDRLMVAHFKTLQHVVRQLSEGKTRGEIIGDLRSRVPEGDVGSPKV